MSSSVRVFLVGASWALLACGDDAGEEVSTAPPVEMVEEVTPAAPEPAEPVALEEAAEAGRAAPLAPTLVERSGLHLTRLFTTASLDGREPGEARQVFSKGEDERAYCYFQLENPDATATRLTLSWVDEAGETSNDPSIIEVPAQVHFASYRFTNLAYRPAGEYACLIQNDGREQLGRAPIRVED